MTTTPQTICRTDAIKHTKVSLIRDIIEDSGRPITAREISRRIMGRGEKQLYHMLPLEVAAFIKIRLRKEVKAEPMNSGKATVDHYTMRE